MKSVVGEKQKEAVKRTIEVNKECNHGHGLFVTKR